MKTRIRVRVDSILTALAAFGLGIAVGAGIISSIAFGGTP